MNISIIIPTYNEEENITTLLPYLQKHVPPSTEILVVDGGSDDGTISRAEEMGVRCLSCAPKGRAAQMNAGAKHASGDVLYFVHADSLPPATFADDIKQAIDEGYPAGCFRFRFDSDHLLLKINSFMTRFDRIMCRGGDQTLYIECSLFDALCGFRDDYVIMEDYDLIERIQESVSFKIIPKDVIVSARKYEENNYLQVQAANFVVFMMYFWGCSQKKLVNTYKKLLVHPKV